MNGRFFLDINKTAGASKTGISVTVLTLGVFAAYIFPGLIYNYGMHYAWFAIGLAAGLALTWVLMARRLMLYATKNDSIYTVADYFKVRYSPNGRAAGLFVCLVELIFSVAAMTFTLSSMLRLTYNIIGFRGFYITALVCALVFFNTAFYGLKGVISEKSAQLIFIFLGLIGVSVIILFGSPEVSMYHNLFDSRPIGGMTSYLNIIMDGDEMIGVRSAISLLSWGLIVMGVPVVLNTFLLFSDTAEMRRSRDISILLGVLLTILSCFLGVLLRAYLGSDVISREDFTFSELYIKVVNSMMDGNIYYKAAGVMIFLSVLMAGMAVLGSCLQLFNETLLSWRRQGEANGQSAAGAYSILIPAIGIAASLALAVLLYGKSTEYIALILAMTGTGLGPATLMSIRDKSTNHIGIAAGIISGMITPVIWNYAPILTESGVKVTLWEYSDISGVLPGFIISVIIIRLVSRMTGGVSKEALRDYEEVRDHLI